MLIETPHPALLDRKVYAEAASEYLADQLAALDSLVNYGTNLVFRCLSSSPMGLVDTVVLGTFLKHVFAMADGVTVLVRAGISQSSQLHIRSMFEAALSLEWTLASNSEHRALAYFVWNKRQELKWARSLIPGREEQKAYESLIAKALGGPRAGPSKASRAFASDVERRIVKTLSEGRFATMNTAFDEERGKRPVDPHWYTMDGVRSTRKMAEQLNRLADYEAMFAIPSREAHASNYRSHMRFRSGTLEMAPLRHLEGVEENVAGAMALCLRTSQLVLEHYRHEEVAAWRKKYLSMWRKPFLSVHQHSYDRNEWNLRMEAGKEPSN